ncbi:uncharacterized protein LOC143282385 [Babylonia areolata]|uniref:uncharacterized protein LOC143282385 n=1 Tax=Babylonia areolata TaxID=304850 RepID=UPI003FD5B420
MTTTTTQNPPTASSSFPSSSSPSVRPTSSKLPWGTILRPRFGLGHQTLSEDRIDQAVKRLYTTTTTATSSRKPRGQFSSSSSSSSSASKHMKSLSQDEIDAMLERLTKVPKEKIPDSDRRLRSSIYRDMGVVSSYAWQGYN